MDPGGSGEARAWFGGRLATGLVEVASDPAVLDEGGWWAVVLPYVGEPVLARFGDVRESPAPDGGWTGPPPGSWTSSASRADYLAAVERVRELIAQGEVYQANVCRVLTAELPDLERADVAGLAQLLAAGNPAPYAGVLDLPPGSHPALSEAGVRVVSASPELFLRKDGATITSGPIKGTGRTAADLTAKDAAENVMIVDLVRNDLGAVCRTSSVSVPQLLAREEHPGLVHLVSYVRGELRGDARWTDVLAATFPPGSVTGAPKSSALRIIDEVEPAPRGPYCGAVGWIDADRGTAELAVAIRTFWLEGSTLRFGTGAGITWGSDAAREWDETELKAERLLSVASGRREPRGMAG